MTVADPPGPMIGAKYRFLSRIARGGMAELFLGEAIAAGGVSRRVALKRILPKHAIDAEYLEMFLEEARLAAQLQHPNIVQTYDVVHSGDEYVIVMELLEGADLYQLKRKMRGTGQVMTLSQVLYVATSLLNGLHYAHEARAPDGHLLGIVHRDISPQNIFVTYDGGVKLLDFGIAKTMAAQDLRTESGVLKGKVRYMSPEQCTGQPVDRRADVYAVGVVLYQLITGVVPHRGRTPIQTMRSILDDPAVPPHEMDPRIDPALSEVVLRALAKNPDDRYPTARDLQLELGRYVEDSGLYVSAPAMSAFVEAVLGPRGSFDPSADDRERSDGPSFTPRESRPRVDGTSTGAGSGAHVLFESATASVKRLAGALVLELTGTIDERFDRSAFTALLRGEVLVDSSGVTRITSFGIRQLLTLFAETHRHVTGLYHVRCSVEWMHQIAMIRNLLGGGRIVSFHAPYVDPATGRSFAYLLRGDEAREAVGLRRLPTVPSPTDPSATATFDDEPAVYLNFAEDFLAEVPRHLQGVVQAIEDSRRQPLDIELTVNNDGSTLHIRSALRSERWRHAVMSLEGSVRIDLTDAPPATEPEIRSFAEALDSVSEDLVDLRLVGAPLALLGALVPLPTLRSLTAIETVQIVARCRVCGADRRVCVPWTDALGSDKAPPFDPCARCGGVLAPTPELATTRAAWSGRSPVPAPSVNRPWTPISLDRIVDDPTPPDPVIHHTLVSRTSEPSTTEGQVEVPAAMGYLFAASFALAVLALVVAVGLFVLLWPG